MNRTAIKVSQVLKSASPLSTGNVSMPTTAFKVLCIGAGTGGISAASTLSKKLGINEVGIIEPSENHYQQPMWTLVGAGLKKFSDTETKMSEIMPERAKWIKEKAASIDPEKKLVVLSNGLTVSYEYLILAPGIELNFGGVEGLKDAIGKDGVASNYSPHYVESTFKFIKEFKGGNALFTMPASPIKCPGAPQKIAYLAEEMFRDQGVRKNTNVGYYTGIGKIFGIDKYANSMWNVANKRGINVNLLHDLVKVDPTTKEATFKILGDGPNANTLVKQKYDFLHVTPPMKPYDFLKNSGLVNKGGFVDVNNETLQHTKYSNIYAIGDCNSAPTSKTAAAACVQANVVKTNLLNKIFNGISEPVIKYDGYTSCPLITGKNSVVLAEFSGYTGKPKETFFYNQGKESKFSYWLTADVLPQVYWKLLTTGQWAGPSSVRPILNPLNSN
ncbi:hypothetical protein BB558_001594 [Smittium angustum]|uniref:Sulfide:quinone oxidoreductase, mitochondrial n=1 Tax=Smittium angustum TaxID=133377 RepID=A0A2U1JB00_SMIAN|nr:hypothetical protein BB558_001594 [Smittium angustum]